MDYCKWRGDITLKTDPFNYVDGLVFCGLAYGVFDSFLDSNTSLTIKEIAENYNKYIATLSKESISPFIVKEAQLLNNLKECERFKDLKVSNYVSHLSSEGVEQFGAMTIEISKGLSVIAFRGTDDSLVGWNESLQLSYKIVKSQSDAVDYLSKYCKPFKKYIILGHSKGGNLALYASVNCKDYIQRRISEIISYDGPGLSQSTFINLSYDAIKDRYIKICPSYDVVGLLFDNNEKKMIIKSNANGIGQHSIYSWQVQRNKFVSASEFDEDALRLQKAFTNFLQLTSIEDREIFINELFEKLHDSGINNLSDFESADIMKTIAILNNLAKVSKSAKNTSNLLLKELTDVNIGKIQSVVSGLFNDAAKLINR